MQGDGLHLRAKQGYNPLLCHMRYYVIAGEASGDLHGAHLIKALKQVDPSARFRGWGGDLMRAEGLDLVGHYRDTAFMGFAEVLTHLGSILKNLSACKRDLKAYQPAAVILIDYPGFNLRIAGFCRRLKIKTYYYISPQVWAWRASRVHMIQRRVDRLFSILPFEKAFYARYGYEVDFVGHPLLDVLSGRVAVSQRSFAARHQLEDKPIIALLPGSRQQEIRRMLPLMLAVAGTFRDYQFVVAAAPGQVREFYEGFSPGPIPVVHGETYDLLSASRAALISSGTATLEAALLGVPQVVCYKGHRISHALAKRLLTIKHISLVNLILDRAVVKELIQQDLTAENIETALRDILQPTVRAQLLEAFAELREKLGGSGASARTAQLIAADLKDR